MRYLVVLLLLLAASKNLAQSDDDDVSTFSLVFAVRKQRRRIVAPGPSVSTMHPLLPYVPSYLRYDLSRKAPHPFLCRFASTYPSEGPEGGSFRKPPR